MSYQWDHHKARSNRRKHGISSGDAVSVFMDHMAITIEDDDPDEERFVTIGSDAFGRILVVVYTYRGSDIRLISASKATRYQRSQYESES